MRRRSFARPLGNEKNKSFFLSLFSYSPGEKSRDGYVQAVVLVGHDRDGDQRKFFETWGEVNLRFRVCIHLFEDKQLVMVYAEEIREKYF